jgi:uncharacterized protein YoxC
MKLRREVDALKAEIVELKALIKYIHNRGRMTKQFNEAQATLEYLTSQLILARQTNELLTENNRRLENMLIKQLKNYSKANAY